MSHFCTGTLLVVARRCLLCVGLRNTPTPIPTPMLTPPIVMPMQILLLLLLYLLLLMLAVVDEPMRWTLLDVGLRWMDRMDRMGRARYLAGDRGLLFSHGFSKDT